MKGTRWAKYLARASSSFNDDAELFFSTLQLDEGEEFSASDWVMPRRLMVRVGVEF